MEKLIKTELIYKEYIIESYKPIKYLLNCIIISGSLGFLSVGISSYLKYDIIPFLKADQIIFFPQGLTMCFYGFCGILVGMNQMRILILKIGEGYNEFNKEQGTMTIVRRGANSDINITYPLNDIEALRLEIKTELFNTKQKIFVCIKEKNELPIIQLEEPMKIQEIEEKASELASFLQVPIKGI